MNECVDAYQLTLQLTLQLMGMLWKKIYSLRLVS